MTSSLGVVDRHGFVVSYVKGQGLMLVFLENGESSRANGHPSIRFNSNSGLERRRKKFQTGPTPGTFRRLSEEICLSNQVFQISKIMLHDGDEERMHFLRSI